MIERDLERGIPFLAEAGLNLFAVLECAALPSETEEAMLAAGVPLAEYARLVLIGHGLPLFPRTPLRPTVNPISLRPVAAQP